MGQVWNLNRKYFVWLANLCVLQLLVDFNQHLKQMIEMTVLSDNIHQDLLKKKKTDLTDEHLSNDDWSSVKTIPLGEGAWMYALPGKCFVS